MTTPSDPPSDQGPAESVPTTAETVPTDNVADVETMHKGSGITPDGRLTTTGDTLLPDFETNGNWPTAVAAEISEKVASVPRTPRALPEQLPSEPSDKILGGPTIGGTRASWKNRHHLKTQGKLLIVVLVILALVAALRYFGVFGA